MSDWTHRTIVPPGIYASWKKTLNQYGILYLYAMSGLGKTVQALTFAEEHFKEWAIFGAKEEHFLSRAAEYLQQHANPRLKTLMILDDLQWILQSADRQTLANLLLQQTQQGGKVQIILLSRSALPDYLAPFRFTKQLICIGEESLLISPSTLSAYIEHNQILKHRSDLELNQVVARCMAMTQGYGLGVMTYLEYIQKRGQNFSAAEALVRRDVVQYFDSRLFQEWSSEYKEAMVKLAVFPSFTLSMAVWILGERAKAILRFFLEISSFFRLEMPDTYHIHPIFLDFLRIKQQTMGENAKNNLYERAGQYYADHRSPKEALRCYREAGCYEKVIALLIDLNENAGTDTFARIGEAYMDTLPAHLVEQSPRLLGAKAVLASYQMKPEESEQYLEQLRLRALQEEARGVSGDATESYLRTQLTLPHDTCHLPEKLMKYSDQLCHCPLNLHNIIPSGNMPSILNGALDTLNWAHYPEAVFTSLRKSVHTLIGIEGIGVYDVHMGETLYEKNQRTEAMGYLVKGLSDANFKGSIRMQYAATAVIARLFQSEYQVQAAREILSNVEEKVKELSLWDLLPNVHTSLILCALLQGETDVCQNWLNGDAPNEYAAFYITDRFRLFTKAKVQTALGHNLEALYIINLLEEYARLYHRPYLHWELQLLRSILLFRRGEAWQHFFIETVQEIAASGFVRILADWGAALLPLWQEIDWAQHTIPAEYIETVTQALQDMALYYPDYLRLSPQMIQLSEKEKAVLLLMAGGCNNPQIAEQLNISISTVKFHVSNLLKKLGAENRTMAVTIGQHKRLIP